MRIGILGGSFDPIHKGHLTLARLAQKQFRLDKVLFLPAWIPPHKQADPDLAPASFRTKMVELAIANEPRWELCDLELKRAGISYTVETLRELREVYPPPDELFFIAGADSLADLPHWKEPEEILRLSQWIVAPRSSSPWPTCLEVSVHQLVMEPLEISASDLRRKMTEGEDVSAAIPPRVWQYIQENRLYHLKAHD